MTALIVGQWRANQQLSEANNGSHRRAYFMAHIRQEATARRSRGFSTVTRGAGFLLHEPARRQIGGQFHHFEGVAIRVVNGVVRSLNPDFTAAVTNAPVLSGGEQTFGQVDPELPVILAVDIQRVTEQAV